MTEDLTPEEQAEEEEVVAGLLPFPIDGVTRLVPELKWRPNRAWQDQMQAAFAALIGVPSDTPDGLRAMADVERELVQAYDATGAMGDLEDATEREISGIYERLIEVSYPQAQSRTAVMVMLVRQAVASAQESSTNGPSPAGATAAPTTSRTLSPSARSTSSTARPRSARRANSASA